MAIQWSGVSGRMQVGIDVRVDGYDTNTPAINVYVDVWVRVVNWRYTDDQVAYLRGSIAADYAYRLNEPSTATREYHVGTYTIAGQGQSYGGGPVYTFSASIGGAYDGSAPSITFNWALPPRPPNVPTPPSFVGVDTIGPTSARIVIHAADGRGSGVSAYQTLIGTNGTNVDTVIATQVWNATNGGTHMATGLKRATAYAVITRAFNGVGPGGWYMTYFTTAPTVPTPGRNLRADPAKPNGPSDVSVLWDGPLDDGGRPVHGWDVAYATSADFTQGYVTQAVMTPGLNAWTFTGLEPGRRYWVRVRPVNAVGVAEWVTLDAGETLSRNRVRVPGLGWTPVRVHLKVPGVGWRTVRVWKRAPGGTWHL